MTKSLASLISLIRAKYLGALEWRQALKLVWGASPAFFVANVATILGQAVVPLVFLLIIREIIDLLTQSVATPGDIPAIEQALSSGLGWWLLAAAGVGILLGFLGACARMVTEIQAQVVTDEMYRILQDKAVEVDLSYYEQPQYRDTLHRAQASAHFRPMRILQNIMLLARHIVSLAVMAGLLFSFHWFVVPVLVLITLPGVLLRLRFSSELYSWERRATADERLASYYNELLNTEAYAKDIRLYRLADVFRRRFFVLRSRLRAARIRRIRNRSLADFSVEVLTMLGVMAALAWMARSVLLGDITLGGLVMYVAALQRAWTHLGQAIRAVSGFYEDNLFLKELFEFLNTRPTVRSPPDAVAAPRPIKTGIRFDAVSFTYPTGTKPALQEISMTVAPGEHIALVGHNGSGKSTLIKLLCRLYDVNAGAISVDGTDLRSVDLESWRRQLGVLTQDYSRFQLSARDNIWLGNVDLDSMDPQILEAAHTAGAHDILDNLLNGYDTLLGHRFKNGHELSGGQWQKVALARLFARDASVLILDEPTSALDPEAEDELLRNFDKISRGRTTVLISHRLSAVKMVDTIYMLEHGRIVEQGSHNELMARMGPYARLYEMQAQRYKD
jgi:ATP-binding cassette, subfamily B, bacterial